LQTVSPASSINKGHDKWKKERRGKGAQRRKFVAHIFNFIKGRFILASASK
jgi:hypothetical protein